MDTQSKEKKVQNTEQLGKPYPEIRKQHLFMFYFSLVKIYIIYVTHTEESLTRVRNANRKACTRGGLFISFQRNQHSGARQLTIKATKAQEACVQDSEELNQETTPGLQGMEVISGERTAST